MTHLDNRLFKPVMIAELDDVAWLAVDSCATGIHAVVEIELEPYAVGPSGFAAERFSGPLPLQLEYAPGYTAGSKYGRFEGPICMRTSQWKNDLGLDAAFDEAESCMYRYTAEFELEMLPSDRHPFLLQYNHNTIEIAQR